jgi:hypothetical protein
VSIEELAKLVEYRRRRYEALGLMNTAWMNEVERMQSHLQYDQARRELMDAERQLRDALTAKSEMDSLIVRLRESA